MKFEQLEDLRIFRQAEEIADEIWEEVIKWDYFAKRTVGVQLVEATDSIGANIAEGYGRHHLKDSINFFYFSRGSLEEASFWLRRALKRKLFPESKGQNFITKIKNLAPQINAYIRGKQKYLK